MPSYILFTLLVLFTLGLCFVKNHSVYGGKEYFNISNRGLFKSDTFIGDLKDTASLSAWVRDNLHDGYILVEIGKNNINNRVLSTTIWVAFKNVYKRNEFSNMIIPYSIQWRMYSDPFAESDHPVDSASSQEFILESGPVHPMRQSSQNNSLRTNAVRIGASPINKAPSHKLDWPVDPAKPFVRFPEFVKNKQSVNVYKIDSVERLSSNIGNIPFIKNQNQAYADLFEVRMKLLK